MTYYLYGGDWENRLKQEILLGIGGIRAPRPPGLRQDVYHRQDRLLYTTDAAGEKP